MLTHYLIQSCLSYSAVFIKKINLLRLPHLCFPLKFMTFLKQLLNTGAQLLLRLSAFYEQFSYINNSNGIYQLVFY